MSVVYEIDPSTSLIADENMHLANYLQDHYLSVEVYDADSRFHYASCKIPLFELLRQQKSQVIRAKECEMCAPDTADYKGSIQIIISNLGRAPQKKTEKVDDFKLKTGGQPG